MFCAFSWVEKPELYASLRAAALKWAGAGPRLVYLAAVTDEDYLSPQLRSLKPDELARLKEESDSAREQQNFGGFLSGKDLLDLKGWCNFKLDPTRMEARLTGLVLDPALAGLPPLQNPALHLTLLALLRDMPDLEAIILPFGEFSEADRADLKMFGLAPVDESGRWLTKQVFARKTDFLNLGMDMVTPIWYELKLKVEPALFGLVFRLFHRFGFRDKTWYTSTVKKGPLGEEYEDETGQFTVITYLPDNDRNNQHLADLQTALGNLSIVSPLPEIDLQRVTRLGAISPNNSGLNRNGIYRVGRNLIIQAIQENQVVENFQQEPNDLLIKIKSSSKGFGPQQRYIHPTSQLALELLEVWLDQNQHLRVLDLGTGSGSLAIAAARVGIKHILAIDPSREAVQLAHENVALNGLESQVVTEAGSLGLKDKDESGYTFSEEQQQRPPSLDKDLPFDAILANIFAPNLITMARALSDALRPGGLLISSGIVGSSVQEVTAAYQKVGLELVEKREVYGWYGIVSRKV